MRRLTSHVESDEVARTQLRRELHALKGAGRMLGLIEIADACHATEDLLEVDGRLTHGEIAVHVERLRSLIEGLNGGSDEVSAPEDREFSTGKPRTSRQELRVPTAVVDELADRGARLRVVSAAAEGLVDRLFSLASLAESGAGEPDPGQVLAALATSLRSVALDFESGQRILARLSNRQFDAVLSVQVQPLAPFLKTLSTHAHELAVSLGKEVDVEVVTGDARLDRRIVSALQEAFLHLVRNSVDHGIEKPTDRKNAGKPVTGRIRIEALERGDRVRIQVADDGRGIDISLAIEEAVERGIVSPEAAANLDDKQALRFLFRPGFTTRDETTELSGRGIGLDAVAATVRSVGGDLWISSSIGEGTEVTVEVPLARRGERVLVVGLGGHHIAVPASAIRAYRRVTADLLEGSEGSRSIQVGGRSVDACLVADLLGETPGDAGVMLEMNVGGGTIVLVVDAVLGEEEVMVRPLPPGVGAPACMEGMTLLASGRPVPVLSLESLRPSERMSWQRLADRPIPKAKAIHVLLVDDSRVSRGLLGRLLEDAGFAVTGVESAEDAIWALDRQSVDCVVTDIEMPGIDGLELTRCLRQATRHKHLPIVVVSTLDRPSHRLAGLESGADAYLAKQGLDARELVALIHRVVVED